VKRTEVRALLQIKTCRYFRKIARGGRTLFTRAVQFDFFLKRTPSPSAEFLTVGSQQVPMVLVRNARARRYVLRLRSDGIARVTIPRGGSQAEARRFAERNRPWLERQIQKLAARPKTKTEWLMGTEILLRGELIKIEAGTNGETGMVRFGSELIRANNIEGDLRASIERHLWKLATKEFPPRVFELAAVHQLPVRRVTVRNQRSRWGSCSRRGTISLNWRLIQAPPFVRDYLIFHELAHLREMNHSPRFWREVARLCPDFEIAEQWLRKNSSLLAKS
jgi:predicted metal-dependent hydrolase